MAMPAGAPKDPLLTGLPPLLRPVPGGQTTMGVTAEQLLRAIFEAVSPAQPERAPKTSLVQVVRDLKVTASELGQTKEQVDTFLLGTWPVKNSEWLIYVKKMAAQKTPVRPPYHWWRHGCKDDYGQRRP